VLSVRRAVASILRLLVVGVVLSVVIRILVVRVNHGRLGR
jgi:hypothetical protein